MDPQTLNSQPHEPSTLEICRVSSVDDLTRVWNDILFTVHPNHNRADLLGRLLGCIPGGVIFLAYDGDKLVGFCCAAPWHDETVLLHSLPGGIAGHVCLGAIIGWCKLKGYKEIQLITDHLNGSNFRYLEKSLGFRRKSMVFSQTIC